MQEIEYRVWNKVKERMEYPKMFCIPQGDKVIGWDDIIPLQYTGIKDKNNKKIYEADIIKIGKDYGVVSYSPGEFTFCLIDKIRRGQYYDKGIYNLPYKLEYARCKIVGNIFEDQELIN